MQRHYCHGWRKYSQMILIIHVYAYKAAIEYLLCIVMLLYSLLWTPYAGDFCVSPTVILFHKCPFSLTWSWPRMVKRNIYSCSLVPSFSLSLHRNTSDATSQPLSKILFSCRNISAPFQPGWLFSYSATTWLAVLPAIHMNSNMTLRSLLNSPAEQHIPELSGAAGQWSEYMSRFRLIAGFRYWGRTRCHMPGDIAIYQYRSLSYIPRYRQRLHTKLFWRWGADLFTSHSFMLFRFRCKVVFFPFSVPF